ncbi:MAG: hypothetical protein A2580_11695 [Hydrogenophilales bacterium RIFOXYD1_FULL_62_11]|nr:MAG: hypothetical protein A2580_11695 [Hydrogenophilales bacterium RIFOXYD1_FULL_62_11]
MLQGLLKLDVPVGVDGGESVLHGILVEPGDLKQDPANPTIFRGAREFPPVDITVHVKPDGSTSIKTEPSSDIHENTLHLPASIQPPSVLTTGDWFLAFVSFFLTPLAPLLLSIYSFARSRRPQGRLYLGVLGLQIAVGLLNFALLL